MEGTTGTTLPRLRENVWHIDLEGPESVLITTDGMFSVPTDDARTFMRLRSYCTGHNSAVSIAERSGVPVRKVDEILAALATVGLVIEGPPPVEPPPLDRVRETLLEICRIWSDELKEGYIANELPDGDLPKTVLMGWMLEMYHYIRDFPYAIEHGARFARGRLREVLDRYAGEERGHEEFVLRTLTNMGLKREEVERSHPLPSTRLVGFLMRELFEIEPAAVLMMAALVEAQEFETDDVAAFSAALERRFDLPRGAMAPYFQHQKIDSDLGHCDLLQDNIELFTVTEPAKLDAIVNRLHDLKHAFELQGTEIKSYYGDLQGKYFPRQPVGFSSL